MNLWYFFIIHVVQGVSKSPALSISSIPKKILCSSNQEDQSTWQLGLSTYCICILQRGFYKVTLQRNRHSTNIFKDWVPKLRNPYNFQRSSRSKAPDAPTLWKCSYHHDCLPTKVQHLLTSSNSLLCPLQILTTGMSTGHLTSKRLKQYIGLI